MKKKITISCTQTCVCVYAHIHIRLWSVTYHPLRHSSAITNNYGFFHHSYPPLYEHLQRRNTMTNKPSARAPPATTSLSSSIVCQRIIASATPLKSLPATLVDIVHVLPTTSLFVACPYCPMRHLQSARPNHTTLPTWCHPSLTMSCTRLSAVRHKQCSRKSHSFFGILDSAFCRQSGMAHLRRLDDRHSVAYEARIHLRTDTHGRFGDSLSM